MVLMRLIACFVLFAVVLSGAGGFDIDPPSELATLLVKKAKRAAKAGDFGDAYVYYSQASAIQPNNKGYRAQAAAMRARGASQVKSTPATAPLPVSEADIRPSAAGVPAQYLLDSVTVRELAQDRVLASPPKLDAAAGRYDFDLNKNPRALFGDIGARFNLQVVFDSDYPPAGNPVRFRIGQVDYRAALDALQVVTGSFVVPMSPHVILVARDTTAKRQDLEQFVTLTLNVPQLITAQELTEMVQVVRQATNVEKIGWDTYGDQIVIRDRVSRAALAQSLLSELLKYHPEVMIDLELLQVSDSDLLNYGFTVTNSFPLVYLGSIQNSVTSIPSGLTNLLTFGAGRTLIGIAAAQVQAMFNETSSTSRSLYAAQLRAASGQPGTFNVGEKYPIITSGFVSTAASGTNATGSNLSYAAPPAISFENLGLELKATPIVHGADEVTLAIEATYEVLSGQSANGIPVIESNKIKTEVRVRDGEWALVGGLMGDSKTKSTSGFWGLASLPLIGNLFKQTSIDKESSQLLVGVRPHILYMGPSEEVMQALRAGSDAHPFTPF